MRGVLLLVLSSLVIVPGGRESSPPPSSAPTPRPPPSSTPTPRRPNTAFFGGSRPAASSTLTPRHVVPLGESRRSAPRSTVSNLDTRMASRLRHTWSSSAAAYRLKRSRTSSHSPGPQPGTHFIIQQHNTSHSRTHGHRHENDNSSTAHQFSCCIHRLISGIWATFSHSSSLFFSRVGTDFPMFT